MKAFWPPATGMVLSSSGVVLTNNHVIDGATSIRATDIGNHKTYSVRVVGYDYTSDTAVLQLEGARRLGRCIDWQLVGCAGR